MIGEEADETLDAIQLQREILNSNYLKTLGETHIFSSVFWSYKSLSSFWNINTLADNQNTAHRDWKKKKTGKEAF